MVLHKAIKGYEDYLVSSDGKVYSLKNHKYLKRRTNTNGYLVVNLCKTGNIKTFLVHRLVAVAFLENNDNKPQVDHINRNKTDNRVENLRWVDNYENLENRDHSKVREAGLKGAQAVKEKYGVPIIEVINDEVSVAYLSLSEVPNINISSLIYRINKGETDFTIKQRNGRTRHFKTVFTERSEL